MFLTRATRSGHHSRRTGSRSVLLLALLLATPVPAAAQLPDSAQVARAETRAAAAALRRGDSAAALASLQHAVAAWPTQGAYRLALARLAAGTGRPALALASLDTLVLHGGGWEESDPALAPLAGSAGFAPLVDRMRAATGPRPASVVLASLPDTMLHPEGVAWDAARQRWLVSSIRQRRVVAVDRAGRMREFLAPGQDGLDAVFGLAVDSSRGLLWAVSSAVPEQQGYVAADSGRAALFAFDLATGRLRGRSSAPPVAGGHLFGDLVLAPDGAVYVSDSRYPAIYVTRRLAAPLDIVIEGNAHFRSLQGLALSADGRTLYAADWSHGLLRVDLRERRVAPVLLEGQGTLLGIDGLLSLGPRRLLGIQNGVAPPRVVRLTLDEAGERVFGLEVLDRHLPLATEPTLATRTGTAVVYIGNSPWSNYAADGRPLAGAHWPRPVLLRLELPSQ